MNSINYEHHFVTYTIYPKIKTDDGDTLNMEKFRIEIMDAIEPQLNSYIWQKDKFELSVNNSKGESYLEGSLNCEYNLEDEWFVVFLLLQISAKFDVIIRVVDTDGEFLLIEAASVLEKWMKPAVCDGRVYIFNGAIHMIAPSSLPGFAVNPVDAIRLIRRNFQSLEPKFAISNAIYKKICGYPEQIEKNKHHAQAYIPVKLAALLNEKPELIAAAINALNSEDARDKNAFNDVKYFKREGCVMYSVTFTKCLYAMASMNEYVVPNIRNSSWYMTKDFERIEKEYKLGYKIAMGFELMVASQEKDLSSNNPELLEKYMKRLEEKGYFMGALPGSKKYQKLQERAKNYFAEDTKPFKNHRSIINMIEKLEYDFEHFKQMEQNLPSSDSDDWMTISETDLMKMLESRSGIKTTRNPQELSCALNYYLTNKSDRLDEYVADDDENEDDEEDDDDDDEEEYSDSEEEAENDNCILFKQDEFFSFIRQQLEEELNEEEAELIMKDKFFSTYADLGKCMAPSSSEEPTHKYRSLRCKAEGEDDEEGENDFQTYLDMMDKELASTTLAESFVACKKKVETMRIEDSMNDETESVAPVDIEENALQNLTLSCEEQAGGPGPAGNLLSILGLRIGKT